MVDSRLSKLADLMVHYSVSVKPGDWVGIIGDVSALPGIREVYKTVLDAGGNPSVFFSDEWMARQSLRNANQDQLNWVNPSWKHFVENADAIINLRTFNNTRAMTNIDPKRLQTQRAAMGSVMQTYMQRAARNELLWVLTQYPTEASAQEANMSLEEYEDFVYGACYCDRDDPVAEWRKVDALQAEKVDWLKGKKEIVCKGPNVDLKLSIEDRVFVNANGQRNMPDGEIFTGPVEDSVNGWVRFSYPSIVGGRAVAGIELRFEDGKVVDASAEQNEDLLFAQLDTDAGSRYLGEFAIGTNFGIQQFTGNILFDEKIGGTIHMAVGNGYPETGSKNKSAVHWDMICDMRVDSEIIVDGELFYRNGKFVV
ncbi:aminopeptidase [Anaerolineales bacterium]